MTDADCGPGMFLEIGADELPVLGPVVERVGRAVRAHEAATASHEIRERGFLIAGQRQLSAGEREKHDIVAGE